MTPLAYAKILSGIGVLLFAGWVGRQTMAGENAALRIKHAHTLQTLAEKTAKAASLAVKASEANRQRESEQAQKFVELALENRRKVERVQANADAVVRDLRAGNLRLRQQWAGCLSAAGGSAEAATSAGGTDGEADVSGAGFGRVLGIVGACQAHVESLQSVLTAERQP